MVHGLTAALRADLLATKLDNEAYKAMKAERRLSPAMHDIFAFGAMAAALYTAPVMAHGGNAKLASVRSTEFPPADASVDAVRAWAATLCKDASTIVAALDGIDGAALHSTTSEDIFKPPRPKLPYGKKAVLRIAFAAPTPALRAFIARCVAPDPAERFDCGAALLEEGLLAG